MRQLRTEAGQARAILAKIINAGYEVRIWDGEAYATGWNDDYRDQVPGLFATDMDRILARRYAGANAGSVTLVYGNGAEDLIQDMEGTGQFLALFDDLSELYEEVK